MAPSQDAYGNHETTQLVSPQVRASVCCIAYSTHIIVYNIDHIQACQVFLQYALLMHAQYSAPWLPAKLPSMACSSKFDCVKLCVCLSYCLHTVLPVELQIELPYSTVLPIVLSIQVARF